MATAHHGPELFIGFLPRYIDVFTEETRSKSFILEAAEYIGNWKKAVLNGMIIRMKHSEVGT